MEKEMPPPESLASVTIKPDYAPSEAYSQEPPPAYHRPKAASVQVAKIIAVTVVIVSVVLGGCMLASAYITANASCKHLEQELEMLTDSMDRYQQPLQPEALVQEEPIQKHTAEPLEAEETKSAVKEQETNSVAQDSSKETSEDSNSDSNSDSSSSSEEDSDEEPRIPIQIKLPIQLDFDDLAGAMMGKNQRSKMNCVVEKKHAEEVVDHQPKTVNLPFGVNITTDPRYERLSGERIAIFCETGNVQRSEPEEQEETIMIQPVMIPLPPPQFHTHMPMQAEPEQPHFRFMVAPQNMPNQKMPMQPQPVQSHFRIMGTMPPPSQPNPMVMQMQQANSLNQLPPNPILHHIAQQIIAEKLKQEAENSQEEVQTNEVRAEVEPQQRTPLHRINVPQQMAKLPIPEEILTQINRLPNRDMIIVSQQESQEDPQEYRVVQEPRSSAQGMNGRQYNARAYPAQIPVQMMQEEQEQEPEASASEELRQHYVHPRSIRSVDDFIPKSQKRVKRCNCDCAC